MEQNVPSVAVLVALAIAVLLLLLFTTFLLFYSQQPPVPSRPSPASSKIASIPHLDAMEPVMIPVSYKTSVLGVQSLLDIALQDQLQFPSLQPRIASGPHAPGLTRSASAPRLAPIIRQGSPINVTSESGKRSGSTENLIPDIAADEVNAEQPVAIHWALSHASVFNSHEEELQAFRNRENTIDRRLKDSLFFQWGLRYLPGSNAENIYRAVLIEMLPSGVSLDQILPRIRGGQVYSATLCDTSPITNGWTALIVFVQEKGAEAFLRRVTLEGFYVDFKSVLVRRVSTPTYILNSPMVQQLQNTGATRCLAVSSDQDTLKVTLHHLLTQTSLHKQVECFGEHDAQGVTTIRFNSIRAAMRAHELLDRSKILKASVRYDADPCSA